MNILSRIFSHKIFTDNNKIDSIGQALPDFDKLQDFKQIISIFDYVFNPNEQIAQTAAETIHRLFVRVSVFNKKEFYDTFKYLKIDKSDIDKFEKFTIELKTTLLSIATFNSNGYSREKALDQLIEIKGQRIFPFVLFLLADWVLPIRNKAEKIIEQYLNDNDTLIFIQNSKLINWLLKVQRVDYSLLYGKIIYSVKNKRLSDKEINELKEGERFFYYKVFIQNNSLDSEIVESILNDKYYLIRLILIEQLDKIPEKKIILSRLLVDKAQKVRQCAINRITNQNIEDYLSILEPLIYDSSASVRFESRRLLSKVKERDFRRLYVKGFDKSGFLIGSILGLSEVGNIEDVSLISSYLNSTKVKAKIASIFGIYNLDKDLATENCYKIIESDNPANIKKACEFILSKQGIDLTRLRNIYDLTDYSGKMAILRLINKFSGWSAAGDYLKALIEKDDKLSQNAKYFLEAWDRYTIRLGTRQTIEDKEYVLKWFYKAKELGLKVPENIPFIFGER